MCAVREYWPIKAGAYVVAAAQHVRMAPFRAPVAIDGHVHHDGDAVMTLVGTVGRIQAGIDLLPPPAPPTACSTSSSPPAAASAAWPDWPPA